MNRLDGRIALVAGARTGIGRATALQFGREGATVLVGVRKAGDGKEVVDILRAAGGDGHEIAMDASVPNQVEDAMHALSGEFGCLDILVTNAGIEQPRAVPINEIKVGEMDRTVDINLKGTWLAIHYAIPHLTRPGATICLVSSLWGFLGGAGLSAYSATKGGINAMTRALAVEHGSAGIRVNCVSPGAILTPMLERFTGGRPESFNAKANVPLERIGRPEEVAEAIVWLCSDEASYVTGQVLGVDGGMPIKMPSAV